MANLQITVPEIKVYIGNILSPNARPLTCTIGSGSNGLAEAAIEIQPMSRQPGQPTSAGKSLTTFDQSEVEILVGGQIVHWGKILSQRFSINDSGEHITILSRIDDHHFGLPLRTTRFYHGGDKNAVALSLPTVFNPELDGVIKFNRSDSKDKKKGYHLFIHEQATATHESAEYNGGGPGA